MPVIERADRRGGRLVCRWFGTRGPSGPRSRPRTLAALAVLAAGMSAPAQAAPGDLDPTFSGDGWATTPFGTYDFASGVALQDDDKIVVAGTTFEVICDDDIWCSSPAEFALARFNADGTPDPSFAGDGKQTTDFGGAENGAYDATIQSDGKIVVVGHAGGGDFALARYDTDGSLDTTFSGDGKEVTLFDGPRYGTNFGAYGVGLLDDGRIIAAGRTGSGDFAVARYLPDGLLDPSFSEDGKASADLGGFDYARAVAIRGDGRIVLAGTSSAGTYYSFALARFDDDGSLDTSFSGDGKEVTDLGGRHNGMATAIQADSKIVVAGSVNGHDNGDFALARYNDDGSLDRTFGVDGSQTTDFGGEDFGRAVAIQRDGKVLVAGTSQGNVALARYTVDGTLDTVFSDDGKATTDLGGLDEASDVVIQPDGDFVTAGRHDGDFLTARFVGELTNGSTPANISAPTISGAAVEGEVLTVDPGVWSGSAPITLAHQWRRCDPATNQCTDIAVATATTYTLVAADVGHTVRVRETASNAYGQGFTDSAATTMVRATPGALAGTVRDGRTGSGLANASVSCGDGYSATTMRDGRYAVGDVPVGTRTCTARAKHYTSSTQTVSISSGQTTTADFALRRR